MPTMQTSNPVSTDYVRGYLARVEHTLRTVDPKQVAKVGELLTYARNEGKQVFLCGNGGSAALASHLAVDIGKGCSRGLRRVWLGASEHPDHLRIHDPWRNRVEEVMTARNFSLNRCSVVTRFHSQDEIITVFRINDPTPSSPTSLP